ncbi:MAG: HAMP domain-containing protein [Deltaproteobacteria bacterium]|nr:HAMP domain-containing protein [Deltaproteobacteria bacterium]
MSGLFARIFIWFWLAITIVTVGFVLIAAATFPEEQRERFEQRAAESMTLRGQRAVAMLAADPSASPSIGSSPEQRAWLFRGAELALPRGTPADPLIMTLGARAAAAPEGTFFREQAEDGELFAVAIGQGYAVVSERRVRSPFDALTDPVSLPWRLMLVVFVSGLVALAIGRHLTRPVRALREATGKIAAGDLAVRVSPDVAKAGGELAALGRDFDVMAERLEQLLESQRRLLRDVSHELRSPLARLGVALELARKRSGPEAKGDLDRIERESERLAALIGEILTLTKLEAAEAAEPEIEIDLPALVDQIVADVDYEAQGSGRRVVVLTPAEQHLPIRGRPEALRRAIENVLRNAVRFTPEGMAVEVKVNKLDDGGRPSVELVVSDRGPGVPEDALEAIFRPFYRVGEDRDRKTGGAGIGLAIVHRAVTLHGGSVAATNRPAEAGGGLELRMRLPAAAPTSAYTS